MGAIQQTRQTSALPSIEKARQLLTQCRSVQEVLRVKALAQAVASCEASEKARDEAAAIVLLAKARIGELTKAMAKVSAAEKGRRSAKNVGSMREQTKVSALEAEGLSRKEAAECEKIADLKRSGDLDRVLAAGVTTTSGAVAVAKLEPQRRAEVIAKLGDKVDVRAALAEVRREERVEEIRTHETASLGEVGRFAVVYADPPWRYEYVKTESRAIENQYPTMSHEEICALPVSEACTDDAVLFMWATSPKLCEAFAVLSAWGFTYRTSMVWVKPQIGMGYYARSKHELLLIATRGAPPTPEPANRPESVIVSDRTKHSAKPTEFYEAIERMYPEFAKLELFCRSPRAGWSAWGNQS